MNNDPISRAAFRKKLIDRQMNYAFYDLHLRHEIGLIIDMLDNEPSVEVNTVRCPVCDDADKGEEKMKLSALYKICKKNKIVHILHDEE